MAPLKSRWPLRGTALSACTMLDLQDNKGLPAEECPQNLAAWTTGQYPAVDGGYTVS